MFFLILRMNYTRVLAGLQLTCQPTHGIWQRDKDDMEELLFFKFMKDMKQTVSFFKLSLTLS